MKNIFVILELLYATWGDEGKERRIMESTILKFIISLQVGDIKISSKSC
jgi:hypothetical protein